MENKQIDKPFAITLDVGSSLANKTGSWRTFPPGLPATHSAVQQPVPEQLRKHPGLKLYSCRIRQLPGSLEDADQRQPVASRHGACVLPPAKMPVTAASWIPQSGINSVERFLSDEALKLNWQFDKPVKESGKKVLIVGAGPSGLSAAYHLRRQGRRVTIKEAGPMAGGMMRFGIRNIVCPAKSSTLRISASWTWVSIFSSTASRQRSGHHDG